MSTIVMLVKRPNGKEAFMYLTSIIGPDGKEQCSKKLGCSAEQHWDALPQRPAASAGSGGK